MSKSMLKQLIFLKLFPKVPFKASQMVMMSKSELALAPTLTLKVLVKIRLGQNLPFNSITNKEEVT